MSNLLQSLAPLGASVGQNLPGIASGIDEIIQQVEQERELRRTRRLERAVQIEREGDLRREGRRLIAAQRVAVAKSGVQLTGSPLDVVAETAGEVELAALRSRFASLVRQRELARAEARSRQQLIQGIAGAVARSGSGLLKRNAPTLLGRGGRSDGSGNGGGSFTRTQPIGLLRDIFAGRE